MFLPLRKQAHALPVMPQNLEQPASAPTKHEQMATVRIVLERLLHLQRQTVEAAPHVGVASRQPNSRAIRGRDHRRHRLVFASALISADTVEASTGPVIRIRPPVPKSSSMMPPVTGERSGNAAPGSGKTATGENDGAAAGRHSSCRQRNNWLL
jgi:hypothetical protein